MIEGKKVVITGGAGFIACTVCARLADHNEVVLYDNLTRDNIRLTGLLDHPNVTLIEGDVLDCAALRSAMADATHVVHMAAIVGVRTVVKNPVNTMRVNLIGTFNAIDAAYASNRLERFVDFSTSEVFGTHAYKVEETHITPTVSIGEARWSYAMGKLAGEFVAHSFWHEFHMPVTTVRPFNIYGPWRLGQGAINEIIERAIDDQPIVISGDGSQIRAWCYVDDFVDGVLAATESPAGVGESFNIGNPRSIATIYDTAMTIIRVAESHSRVEYEPLGYVDIEVRIPDIDKARRVLGYEPKVDLEEGIRRTIDWYRSIGR